MTPIDGQPILTAQQMRAAEAAHGDLGGLMERAGAGVADAIRRLSGGAESLVLCGPGNNGGDGYVAARILRQQGHPVRVAALCPPRSSLAIEAARRWGGPVAMYVDQPNPDGYVTNPWRGADVDPAPILVDALFGTGGRVASSDATWPADHADLWNAARLRIAVDLPTSTSAEGHHRTGHLDLHADVTLALGALKPAHVLPSSPRTCGRVRLIDIGLDLGAHPIRVVDRPTLTPPGGDANKFTRGMVVVVAGAMPGAAALAATAAARVGAGYVALLGDAAKTPDAVVRRPLSEAALSDERIGAIVIGPGLGRDAAARRWLEFAWGRNLTTLVVDGDALHLLDEDLLRRPRNGAVILTPHSGELDRLKRRLGIETPDGLSYVDGPAALVKALPGSNYLTVIGKGFTTWISDGRQTRFAQHGATWLSTAGTGDVLAGIVGATVAAQDAESPVEAAARAVWLHSRAAALAGPALIADDLTATIGQALRECLKPTR